MNTFNRPFNQFGIHWSCSLPFNNLKQVHDHRSGIHSPRYFHTTHSVNNYLHWIHSLFQMLQPSRACCYAEIVEDLSLLHQFPQEEYSSTQNFPCLGALWFRLILEGFFTHIASPSKWGNPSVEFVTLTGPKKSGKTTNMVILITDGVGESDLGMVMVFCHPNQARNRDLWCPLHLMPMWLIRAEYGGDKEIFQQLSTSLDRHPVHFLWVWALSPGALLPPNLH